MEETKEHEQQNLRRTGSVTVPRGNTLNAECQTCAIHYLKSISHQVRGRTLIKANDTQEKANLMHQEVLILLWGSQRSCTGGEERMADYRLASLINLSLCYIACNLCARSSHVIQLIKSYYSVLRRLWGESSLKPRTC